ncbi:WxL protein peptidoglycan domain-containing protein [Streptacidiphilus sp. N1-12]|uniref:WxL protein peptidoglycan domain-containing protein n=2 Tax=Streptacidiphilus alkalitolerans TaxID=3342712 RepID=A0ABV6WRI2_9ACTN
MHRALTYLRLLLASLLAVGGLALGAGPAAAADNGTWSVFPVPSAPNSKAVTPDRQYFYLEAAPGATVHDKVSVANLSDRPMTFQLYGADAYNTPRDGGFALRAADQKQTGVGAWTHLGRSTLTVAPHTRTDVPFTITVPAGAEPGDHPGAVVALDTAVEATSTSGHVAVGIKRAVGARIYLRVSGPAVPAVSIRDLRIDRSSPLVPGLGASRATIHYTLVNRGNVTIHPKLVLSAKGWIGGTVLSTGPTDLGVDLLPGQQVQLSAAWPHPPQFDHVSLTVSVSGSDASAGAGAGFLAVPWFLVGLVVLLLVAALLLARWLRGRRRRPQPGSGGGKPVRVGAAA